MATLRLAAYEACADAVADIRLYALDERFSSFGVRSCVVRSAEGVEGASGMTSNVEDTEFVAVSEGVEMLSTVASDMSEHVEPTLGREGM